MEIKASLLSSFRLVLYFICVLVLGCALFGVIYMVYNLCENMVAGQSLLFDMNLFLEGLFVVTPFVLMFSALLMVLYLVRHPIDSLAVLVVYGLLCVCVWLVCIPRVVKADVAFYGTDAPSAARGIPSASYFRPDGERIFYYTKISGADNKVTGICLNTDLDSTSDVYTFSALELSGRQDQFTDSLIQGSLAMPPVLSILVKKLAAMNVVLKKCATRGTGYWLCFSSMGLALIAVIGLRYVSKWRLVDVMLVICVTTGIIAFNLLGYTNSSFAAVSDSVNGVLNKLGLFRKLTAVGNPSVVFCNILIFIVLTAAAVIFERGHQKQLSAESGDVSL